MQERTIRSWARANGHRVAELYTDEATSGTSDLAGRPGLAQALAAVKSGRVKAIAVYRVDRLARDLILQEQLLREIALAGGRVHSASAAEDIHLGDDPADPTRALIRQVLGSVSQYERAMIRLRMQAGARSKAEAGGYAYGGPPYGWRAVNKELVAVPEEQEAMRMAATMRQTGASYREICNALTEANMLTRKENPWSPASLRRSLLTFSSRSSTRSAPRRATVRSATSGVDAKEGSAQ